jgi:hypothetical protein
VSSVLGAIRCYRHPFFARQALGQGSEAKKPLDTIQKNYILFLNIALNTVPALA